jgi:hypothetical protein
MIQRPAARHDSLRKVRRGRSILGDFTDNQANSLASFTVRLKCIERLETAQGKIPFELT